MSTNIAASPMEGGEEMEAVNALMVCREEIEQMKGELAAKIVGLESMLVSFGSRFASLEETVVRASQDKEEQSQALSDENQRLLARNEFLEAELRKQKEVVAAYQSSIEQQAPLSKPSCPQLPSLLDGINYEAEDGESEESAAPTNTSHEHGEESLIPSPRSNTCTSKRKRKLLEQDPSQKVVVNKKQYKKECSADGCTNQAQRGGVCQRHGAKKRRCRIEGCTNHIQKGGVCKRHGAQVKQCSSEGCTNQAKKGGVCKRHGAKAKQCNSAGCTKIVVRGGGGNNANIPPPAAATSKRSRSDNENENEPAKKRSKTKKCSWEGCANGAVKGGVCIRHGATKTKKKKCSSEGCTNQAQKGGVCIRHGATWTKKQCSSEGCTNQVIRGGVCVRHGAKKKQCSIEGCTKVSKRGGVCNKHGAYRNAQDESTAFGSEFEMTTTTQTPTNQRDSGAIPICSGRRSVPGEVTILCEEIVEV